LSKANLWTTTGARPSKLFDGGRCGVQTHGQYADRGGNYRGYEIHVPQEISPQAAGRHQSPVPIRHGKKRSLGVRQRRDIPNFKEYRTVAYNDHFRYKKSTIGAVDINHAYWRIAKTLGVISSRTYDHGLPPLFKTKRLAALSTLGKPKRYEKWVDGFNTGTIVEVGEDQRLQLLYRYIRHTCYRYMHEISKLLGRAVC
jgi:hypothetical protein